METPTEQHTRELRGLVELCLLPEPTPTKRRLLGDYELLEKIGKGGMGTVWRARQTGLQRDVAVKILHDGLASDSAFIAAFQQEAEITATLKHPGIVAVYEAGEADGKWYYAMEWVDADNLEDVLREHGTRPVREAVKIVRDAAEALGHAHSKGVLHRDLKPSNLLVDAAGQVRILDFGLARWLGPVASGRTAPLLGTPYYVAPEQADGTSTEPPADVYSLGAVLYRLVCGRVPFAGETPMIVLDQARNSLPIALRRLNASVPEDIEVIVLKCLEKTPRLRYSDANQLAADLTRWLDGKPVLARPVNVIGRFTRWARREPWQAMLVAVLTLGALGTFWQFSQASTMRQVAKRDREMAVLHLTAATMREGNHDEAVRVFTATMEEAAVNVWGFPAKWMRHELTGQRDFQTIEAHQDKIWGMILADSNRALVTASEDLSVAVRDPFSGKLKFSLESSPSPIFGLCAYPDDQKILATAMNGTARILDLTTQSWHAPPHSFHATWATRAPHSQWWATLHGNPHFWEPEGELQIWRNNPGEALHHSFPGKRAAFSPDGSKVAIGRAETKLRKSQQSPTRSVVEIYATASGEKIADCFAEGEFSSVRSLAWSGDGQSIVAAEGKRIHLWQANQSFPLWSQTLTAGVWQVSFAEGEILAACSDQSWHTLHQETGAERYAPRGHRDEVWCVQRLPNGGTATGDKDGQLLLWPSKNNELQDVVADVDTRAIFTNHGSLLTLKGRQLQVRSAQGELRVLDTPWCRSLHGWDDARNAVLAGSAAGDLIWIEPENGKVVHRIERVACSGKREYAPTACGISADGKTLYECTQDGIFLRDPSTGKIQHSLSATPLPMITAAMSHDRRYLLASSAVESRTARLYDVATGQLHFLPHKRDEILACAFSPDGRWLATGGGESTVYVWDLKSDLAKPHTRIKGQLESINGLAFTADGKWLASSGDGGTIRFTLTSTWDSGPTFPCPAGDGILSFSPDGAWLSISTETGQRLIHAP